MTTSGPKLLGSPARLPDAWVCTHVLFLRREKRHVRLMVWFDQEGIGHGWTESQYRILEPESFLSIRDRWYQDGRSVSVGDVRQMSTKI